ncbi:hypothetical protein BSLG_010718 [Batrachochytrium salamandrivorans]|nr:hypothetical protein BSLG_010718 [Batrachochytrium salamandrivorans]
MVTVSLFIALALVSSIVVAQPGENSIAEAMAYLYRMANPEIPTKSIYEWIPPNERAPAPISDEDPVKIGLSYLVQKLSLQFNEFRMSTSFTDQLGVTHVYGTPFYKGFVNKNLHAAVHVKNGQAFFYSTIINEDQVLATLSPPNPESMVEKSSEGAVGAAADCLKVPCHHDTAPVMEYHPTGNKDTPVWKSQPKDEPMTRLPKADADADTGKKRFKMGFTYKVVNLPKESPYDGFSTIVNPENFQSSPEGWTEGYKTIGNNVEANAEGGAPFETTTKGVFDGVFDPTPPPQTPRYTVMGVINAFYAANLFHDITYQYGFTEQAGNFQMNNFNKGGKGGDPVVIDIQSSKETDGAEFGTSLDGQPGVLTLYKYTATEPNRDSALDSTILIHELTHGLTSRLTGGAQTKMCKYVEGVARGIRDYPYATDMRFNPLTYQNVVGEEDQYVIGAIWATMLWEVYWNFVDAHGFSANLHDATQKEGNIIFLQLLVGTLMIQPCKLTFISARDAMLAADDAYYGGVHEHLIRQGFFKRGLGSISQSDPTTDNVV